MTRRLFAAFAVAGAASLVGCGTDERAFPTAGLSPHHARAARFMEREVVLDLSAGVDATPARDTGIASEIYHLEQGWLGPFRSGHWIVGDRARLSVYVTAPEGLHLYLEGRGPQPEPLRVVVNGVDVGVFRPTEQWATAVLLLPEGALRQGVNAIELVKESGSPPTRLPAGTELLALVDPLLRGRRPSTENLQRAHTQILERYPGATIHEGDILNVPGVLAVDVISNLGADGVGTGWQWSEIEGGLTAQLRRVALVEDPDSLEPDTRLPAYGRDRGVLTVTRSGTLIIPVETRQPADVLSFAASTPARLGRSTDVRIRFSEVELAAATLAGWWGRTDVAVDLPLDGHVGPGCVMVDVDLGRSAGPLTLDGFEVGLRPLAPAARPATIREARPDIVVVVLDAARADHFGLYGYGRDTTPHIDRLAQEALVFTHAFATAPYTAASMPTMLTGLSFLDHGIIRQEHALDESITTLAEFLKQAGYRTSCYSANPNNSVARGLGQGCDLFEEFWRNARPPRSLDPYRVSDSARSRLADEHDSPEFMLLHYVPPHEPYLPADGFDVFGDPDYTGTFDGSRDVVLGIDRGRLDPTAVDLAEVISLYDGNLLTADDAVNEVFEALQARAGWENTVVLLVSDHGEAFREHGRMSHNSTVYDEMLHVPFVLRLPGGEVPAHVDTDALVSLEDVVPTLLGLADVGTDHVFSGMDLVGAGARGRRRGLVARTAHTPPLYAYRTPEWKLIEGRGTSELYDTRDDPDERDNLYLDRLETSLCLRSLLRLQVTRPTLGAIAGEGLQLSDDDLATLRSLGYVR